MNWVFWLILSVILALGAGFGTLIWWKVGDQWADAEHKKFGPRSNQTRAEAPRVIHGFDDDEPRAS
ncbi:MAG: hypothetical protein ACIARR_11210 [Phycisphaerales bacterium JB059]